MKKFVSVILSLLMVLSMTACGSSASDAPAASAAPTAASSVVLSGVEDGVLTSGFPLGVSNHFTGEPAHISVRDGSLLVIWDKAVGFPEPAK